MKKQILLVIAIVVFSLATAVFLISRRPEPPRRPPDAQTPLVQVVSLSGQSGTLQVRGSGTVRPRAEVGIAPQVAGKAVYVSNALVSGGYVRKDELLIRIEPTDFEHAVQQALADVAQQEVSVLQAEEETQLARVEYEQFQDRKARFSSEVYTAFQTGDAASVDASNGTNGDAPADEPGRLVFREPQLKAARAALTRAEAQLANAELALSRTEIRAPFTGFVRSKTVAVGSYLSPGQVVAQLVDTDLLEVSVPLIRDDAALIPSLWARSGGGTIGADVFAEYGGLRYRWEGYVDRAEAILDPQTRTINVIVHVPRPVESGRLHADSTWTPDETPFLIPSQPPPLLVGEYVDVALRGADIDRYFAVPRAALRNDNYVWVARSGRLVMIPVEVLQEVDNTVYVRANELKDEEQVIVSHVGVATNGMQIRTSEVTS